MTCCSHSIDATLISADIFSPDAKHMIQHLSGGKAHVQ